MFSDIRDSVLSFRKLSEQGILGMNRRNIDYISTYNHRRLYSLVDNKILTKELALKHGVQSPELLGVLKSQHEITRLANMISTFPSFCIKPAKGSGGKGILIIKKDERGSLLRSNDSAISLNDVQNHCSNILAGLFSLGGSTDEVMIESLLQTDTYFEPYSFEGVPDIRIIVFCGYPVMAMMRLSCAASKGKANLHQGAVGVGVDIATGRAINAIWHGKPVHYHPDTGQDLMSLLVPQWETLLALACRCYDMTGLGYLGVDLVLDKQAGPMLLELNVRPGLSIQIANNCGLLPRLRRIEQIKTQGGSVAKRVAFSQTHFKQS